MARAGLTQKSITAFLDTMDNQRKAATELQAVIDAGHVTDKSAVSKIAGAVALYNADADYIGRKLVNAVVRMQGEKDVRNFVEGSLHLFPVK